MLQKGELPAGPGLGAASWAAELWRCLPSEASPQPRVAEGGNAVASLWRFWLCSSLRHPECLGQIRDTMYLLHPSWSALWCWVSFLHGLAEAGSCVSPQACLEERSEIPGLSWSWPPRTMQRCGARTGHHLLSRQLGN